MNNKSWWTRCAPNTDLDAANEEIGFMREDWQKVGHAFGFEDFVDPEVIIAKAESLTNLHTQTMILKVDAASLADRLTGTEGIVLDIFAERDRQDVQWGGPEHDDSHDVFDWARYIGQQIEKLGDLPDGQMPSPEQARERLVKIAALAVAALESHDRGHPRSLPGDEPQRTRGAFGKSEFIEFLDAALPDSAVFRNFSVEYWGDRAEKDAAGLDNVGRAHAALREYVGDMFPSVRASVEFNAMDYALTIEVSA